MNAWKDDTVKTPKRFKIPFVIGVTWVRTPCIKYKIENTQQELIEREKKTRKQEAQLRDIKGTLANNERKMESYNQKTAVLKAQNDLNNSTNFTKQEMDLKKGILEKEAKMKRVIHSLQTGN